MVHTFSLDVAIFFLLVDLQAGTKNIVKGNFKFFRLAFATPAMQQHRQIEKTPVFLCGYLCFGLALSSIFSTEIAHNLMVLY